MTRLTAGTRLTLPQNYTSNAGTLFEDFKIIGDWSTSPSRPAQVSCSTDGLNLISLDTSNNQMAIKTINRRFTTGDGYISFEVTPSSNVDTIVLGFSSATSFASVYMNYALASTAMVVGKKNYIKIRLSDFSSVGGDTFANTMIRMRVRVVSNNSTSANATFTNLRYGITIRPKIILQSDNAANTSIITKMYPILQAAGMKATLYVQGNIVGGVGELSLADLSTLYSAGWDLGNHSWDHSDLTAVSTESALANVSLCNTLLVDNGFVRANKHIAYPLGATSTSLNSALVGAGYLTGRKTTDSVQGVPVSDYFLLKAYTIKASDSVAVMKSYVDSAISNASTSIIMTEGLADSGPAAQEVLTADYQTLVDYIKTKVDAGFLDVVTISEWYEGLTNPRKSA